MSEQVLDFKWFRDLLIENFPEHMKDYLEIAQNQSGLTPKGLLLQRLKEEAGAIPGGTCPAIDEAIKALNSISKNAHNYRRSDNDELKTLAIDVEWACYEVESQLESLRDDNQQLRSLGEFWYEQFKKLLEASASSSADKSA